MDQNNQTDEQVRLQGSTTKWPMWLGLIAIVLAILLVLFFMNGDKVVKDAVTTTPEETTGRDQDTNNPNTNSDNDSPATTEAAGAATLASIVASSDAEGPAALHDESVELANLTVIEVLADRVFTVEDSAGNAIVVVLEAGMEDEAQIEVGDTVTVEGTLVSPSAEEYEADTYSDLEYDVSDEKVFIWSDSVTTT